MMKGKKTKVFLTGATGVMGGAGLSELLRYSDKYEVTVLARKSKRNIQKLQSLQSEGVRVVWGDLLDENSIKEGIKGADIVLHVGGMVSPYADLHPEETLRVNVGSMRLISKVVKEEETENPDKDIRVVYIGSVSQYGSHNPPNHWGNAESPQRPAALDAYAESKIKAEEELRKAGLKKWVSIRQTAILHTGLLKNAQNPVAFHTPINGVLEWITTEDSGRLLERVCRDDVPDSFWGKAYNAGGGKPFRLTNLEFERGILKALGCPKPEKIFEPNWFAADNFHGMWFEDSDDLDSILHFREPDSFEDALKRMRGELPFYFRFARLAPSFLVKMIMKKVAHHEQLGPLAWIKNNDEERIKVSWGSREEYDKIPGWAEFEEIKLSTDPPSKRKND